MKKKASSRCPARSWLNAKICLPSKKRGIVVSRIIDSHSHGLLVQVSPDPTLNSLVQDSLESQAKLKNLPKGTFILLASHKVLGNKFWVVKTDEFIGVNLNSRDLSTEQYSDVITYTVKELKELKNFMEVRKEERTTFSMPVKVLNPSDFSLQKELFTYDISQNGLSLFLNKQQRFEFELKKEYLIELCLHEASEIKPLRYTCVQKKEDHVTSSYIYGFSLNKEDSLDEKVQYSLSFLTWSGIDLFGTLDQQNS